MMAPPKAPHIASVTAPHKTCGMSPRSLSNVNQTARLKPIAEARDNIKAHFLVDMASEDDRHRMMAEGVVYYIDTARAAIRAPGIQWLSAVSMQAHSIAVVP